MALNPLNKAELSAAEQKTLEWLQKQPWKTDDNGNGVLSIPTVSGKGTGTGWQRLTADGEKRNYAEIEILISKLTGLGVIGKQIPFPVRGSGGDGEAPWVITFKIEELKNLEINLDKKPNLVAK